MFPAIIALNWLIQLLRQSNYLQPDQIAFTQGYLQPDMFGADNKYFLCAMVKDSDKFINRAYSQTVRDVVVSYLEGKEVSEETTVHLSFYFGQKELESLVAVDHRLEKVLDYGWFSLYDLPQPLYDERLKLRINEIINKRLVDVKKQNML